MYDGVGNITREKRKAAESDPGTAISYESDGLGQLTRVSGPFDLASNATGTTWMYEYDQGGNILSKKRCVYTTGSVDSILETIPYAYGNSDWKDQLTNYNNSTNDISYDGIGNPLIYSDWTYAWQAGRQLRRMTQWPETRQEYPEVHGEVLVDPETMVATYRSDPGGTNPFTLSGSGILAANADGYKLVNGALELDYGKDIEFHYDANGLRTQKKVTEGGTVTTTDYTLHGKRVAHQKVTSAVNGVPQGEPDAMHFFYDAQSRPAMVNVNGTLYTYVHNLQGDIVAIVDRTGAKIVEYKYDAWGKHIADTDGNIATGTLKDTLGKLNPFRYRGYVYDMETALYYLRSRYYSSDFCRFLTVDKNYNGNLYAYCYASPVNYTDCEGTTPVEILNIIGQAYNANVLSASNTSALILVFNAGNIYNGFHEIAQLNAAKSLYNLGYPCILEDGIPNVGEADIVSISYIWEVKPWGTSGKKQLEKYILATGYIPGFNIDPIYGIPILSNIKMKVESVGSGVLQYSFYDSQNNKVNSSAVSRRVSEQLFWASLAAGIIIGGTIIEDILSGGAGVADDVGSLSGAGALAAAILGI